MVSTPNSSREEELSEAEVARRVMKQDRLEREQRSFDDWLRLLESGIRQTEGSDPPRREVGQVFFEALNHLCRASLSREEASQVVEVLRRERNGHFFGDRMADAADKIFARFDEGQAA